MDAVAGYFQIDWSLESLERVAATILKKYNAEVHSQTAIECVLQLRAQEEVIANNMEHIDCGTFDVAYHIKGEGMRKTKHS